MEEVDDGKVRRKMNNGGRRKGREDREKGDWKGTS
jgi:hypothetical protein